MEINNFSHDKIEMNKIRKNDSSVILSPLAYTIKEIDLYKHENGNHTVGKKINHK